MIRLAVVGDIGSGKSYVAKQFNYPVFNADAEVAKLYKKSRKCHSKLKKIIGNIFQNDVSQNSDKVGVKTYGY